MRLPTLGLYFHSIFCFDFEGPRGRWRGGIERGAEVKGRGGLNHNIQLYNIG